MWECANLLMKTKNMKRVLYTILVLTAIVMDSCISNNNELPAYVPSDSVLKSFENQLAAYCYDLNINKLSYAVVNNSKIIQSKLISESNSQQTNIENNTVYPIGEMSDIMASILILQQTEAGKTDLKDLLAEYGVNKPGINKATIKQLLSYTYLDKPGTSFIYDAGRSEIIKKVVESVTNDYFSNQIEKGIIDECDMEYSSINENGAMQSTVSDLAKLSIALDKRELFDDTATTDIMYRPVFLSDGEKTPSALGWLVHLYKDKKFAWSFGQGKDYSSLIIKSLSDSLIFIVLANSPNLNEPFGLQDGNLIKSPVANLFLKTFVFRNDTFPNFKLNQPDSLVAKTFEKIKTSKHKGLLITDLISNIRMYEYMDKDIEKDIYLNMYKKHLSNDVQWELLEKKPRAIIDNVGDYVKIRRNFYIDNDTVVNIYAVGEFTKSMSQDAWQYDNVEVFLDLKNDKKTAFDISTHRQYRFNYDSPDVNGNYSTDDNITFMQSDPSKTTYNFEIKFPWKTLGDIKPSNGLKVGFDINIIDNDNLVRDNTICWHYEKQQRPWENPSVFGTMILSSKENGTNNDSLCTSLIVGSEINIDKKIEPVWNKATIYSFTKTTSEKMPDSKDLSGKFRTMWDNENLYFLVEVTDDFKNLFGLTSDFGWIEDEKKDTIWEMTTSNSKYAGGALTNQFVNTTLKLKKGNYTLHYATNQTNSSVLRTKTEPDMNFYGIAVY